MMIFEILAISAASISAVILAVGANILIFDADRPIRHSGPIRTPATEPSPAHDDRQLEERSAPAWAS